MERKILLPNETPGNFHRYNYQHGKNNAVFGRDYQVDDEDDFKECAITMVAQCAVSTYKPCYVDGAEDDRMVKYNPDALRRLTLAEMESMGQWYTNGRDE